VLLASIFAFAGVAKLADLAGSRQVFRHGLLRRGEDRLRLQQGHLLHLG
jgi:hypothetical protein